MPPAMRDLIMPSANATQIITESSGAYIATTALEILQQRSSYKDDFQSLEYSNMNKTWTFVAEFADFLPFKEFLSEKVIT